MGLRRWACRRMSRAPSGGKVTLGWGERPHHTIFVWCGPSSPPVLQYEAGKTCLSALEKTGGGSQHSLSALIKTASALEKTGAISARAKAASVLELKLAPRSPGLGSRSIIFLLMEYQRKSSQKPPAERRIPMFIKGILRESSHICSRSADSKESVKRNNVFPSGTWLGALRRR